MSPVESLGHEQFPSQNVDSGNHEQHLHELSILPKPEPRRSSRRLRELHNN